MAAEPTEAATSRYVDLSKVRLHYNDVGQGPPLICIHGGGPGANSWSNFVTNIDFFSRHYRLLLVDLPRFGKSSKIAIDGPPLTFNATVLKEFMDALSIPKAPIIGNSYGGQVALKTAIDYSDRISSLVLIGSAPVVQSLFNPMPVEAIKLIGGYYRGAGGPTLAKMRQLISTLVFDQSLVTDDVVRERYEASIDPETVKINMEPPPARQDLTAELSKVKASTLVIWGMDDRAGALDVGLLMTRFIPDAQMHIFTRCGHWAQVERKDEFNELVLNFLNRHAV
ncbi:MAG TPA: alpha/beta hydrolase [Steroidobacteraceae bacterium]|nr:alpha/beta hydrolase [Steroidobacteraceae bacterium]